PELGRDDRYRTHESAEARSVRTEDDRHVPGEVDRSDGIRGVVDVRRMKPRFAAVTASPYGLRSDEPHSGPRGVVVDLPLDVVKRAHERLVEDVGRGVRAFAHADLPLRRA